MREALLPGNFVGRREEHEALVTWVNESLAFVGLTIGLDSRAGTREPLRQTNTATGR